MLNLILIDDKLMSCHDFISGSGRRTATKISAERHRRRLAKTTSEHRSRINHCTGHRYVNSTEDQRSSIIISGLLIYFTYLYIFENVKLKKHGVWKMFARHLFADQGPALTLPE
jgi:hypothetical protein